MAGFCIASFLKLQSGNNRIYYIIFFSEYDDFIESNKKEREYSDGSSSLLKEIFTTKDDAEIEHESKQVRSSDRSFLSLQVQIFCSNIKTLVRNHNKTSIELKSLKGIGVKFHYIFL